MSYEQSESAEWSNSSGPVTVSSLMLDSTYWGLEEESPNENVFGSKGGDVVGVELRTEATIFQLDFNDIPALRANIRMGFGGAGLLSADVVEYKSIGDDSGRLIKGVAIITKLPQMPSGRSYNGLIFLPFKDFSFSIYMRYEEGGMTGRREAALADVLLKAGEITIDEQAGKVSGFEEDLYDPHQRGPLVRNKAEREEYDEQFPQHPLSRLRVCMQLVRDSLVFAPVVLAAEQPV
ncbi:MAG: hypothetical protein KGS72_14265 [Cyanobacteria bacterium REEB67]|nr:hypothetical protein [Cyanobacteria bacterium REEB67]